MNHTLPKTCRRMWDSVTRPEVRRSFHYECGIYRDRSTSSPIVALRVDHRCRAPLWRMLAIASALTLLILFVRSCLGRLPFGKRATHTLE